MTASSRLKATLAELSTGSGLASTSAAKSCGGASSGALSSTVSTAFSSTVASLRLPDRAPFERRVRRLADAARLELRAAGRSGEVEEERN